MVTDCDFNYSPELGRLNLILLWIPEGSLNSLLLLI